MVHYFAGIDPAPSEGQRSDDGAIVIGRAEPRNREVVTDVRSDWFFDFVFARRLTSKEKASARQWSGIIHQLHERFRLEKIVLDPGGGGMFIKREMQSPRQLIDGREEDRVPIGDLVDAPRMMVRGHFILHLFKRGDPGVELLWPELSGDDLLNDALYSEFREALNQQWMCLPPDLGDFLSDPASKSEFQRWPEERQWSMTNLTAFVQQARGLVVATNPDGTYALTKRGARQFMATGKKDIVSAAMYAHLAFNIWLKSADMRGSSNGEDAKGFSGW